MGKDNIIIVVILVIIAFLVIGLQKSWEHRLQRETIAAGEHGYAQGQIDALSGVIHYRLVTNETREVTWEKIEK